MGADHSLALSEVREVAHGGESQWGASTSSEDECPSPPPQAPVHGRRGSQDGVAGHLPSEEGRGLPSDEVMSNGRLRIAKLESARSEVGESDPLYATLMEALGHANVQA